MSRLLLIFLCCIMCPLNAQEYSGDAQIEQIEKLIGGSQKKRALIKIDSLLDADIPVMQKELLSILKIEALVGSHLFDEALVTANKVLFDRELPDSLRIKVLLERALLYEYVNQIESSWSDLEAVKEYYSQANVRKDRYYGVYLYRVSSWYRVQGKDSIAQQYAIRARSFGEEYQYPNVIGTANMLLAFTTKDSISREKFEYTQKALENFKKSNENGGVVAMIFSHAKYHKERKEFDSAIAYLDTLENTLREDKELLFRSSSAELKSDIFKEKGQLDSALVYFKKYKELSEEELLVEQEIQVNEIKYEYELEQDKLQNEVLRKDLSQEKLNKRNFLTSTIVLLVLLVIVALLLSFLALRNKRIRLQSEEIFRMNGKLEQTVSEKEFLLKESFHRVKNNLTLILGLIKFQKKEFETNSYAQLKFVNLENRIEAIALAHQNFMPSSSASNVQNFDLKNYIKTIVDSLIRLNETEVALDLEVSDMLIAMDTALPVGIIINELTSNTLKHAKPKNGVLSVQISITKRKETLVVKYNDNGVLFTQEKKENQLGLFIVKSMVQQLDGTLERKNASYSMQLKIKKDDA